MEEWRRNVANRCPGRLGDRLAVVAGVDQEVEQPAIAVGFDRGRERLGTATVDEVDASQVGPFVTLGLADAEFGSVEESVPALQAVMESRLVAELLGGEVPETSDTWARRVADLPFPAVEPVFRAQLAALHRRRDGADEPGSVDRAIERVVAELFALELSELVDLQRRAVSQS